MNTENELQPSEMIALKKTIVTRLILLLLFFGLFTLVPAGTFNFWQVYVYLTILCVPMTFILLFFLKNNPKFLVRRMKIKEQEKQQKTIVVVTTISYVVGFILPGFDYRFGWSNIPTVIVLLADMLVLLSYIFIIYVFKENKFASRIVEVDKNQTVISTGVYSIIRHPMYLGVLVMYIATPIALGSYWALIPFSAVPVALVFRIRNEEKVLREQLPGYNEYCEKVKFRIIPYLW